MKPHNFGNLKILIVDPHKHARVVARMVLRELGVGEFEMADDGDAGFFVLHQFSPDIILSELLMAPMDGLEFTRKVRSARTVPNPYVPIIMMTTNFEKRHIIQARNAGVTEFMVKPLTVMSVYSRLHSIIERPRAFVNAGGYFGPDRRRRDDPSYRGPKRREADRIAAEKARTEAIAKKEAARKAAAEAAARAKAAEVAKLKAEEAARIKAENATKAEVPADPSAMSQEQLEKKLRDKK